MQTKGRIGFLWQLYHSETLSKKEKPAAVQNNSLPFCSRDTFTLLYLGDPAAWWYSHAFEPVILGCLKTVG